MLALRSRSPFFNNILASLTGSTIAQLLPVITAPLLARIYLPQDYGIFGIVLSIAVVISIFSTLQFSSAIIVAKSDEESNELANISVVLTVWTSVISMALLLVLSDAISSFMHSPATPLLFIICPLIMTFQSLNTVLAGIGVRRKLFRAIAINRVSSAVLTAIVSISVGFYTRSYGGLIGGYIVGQVFAFIYMASVVKKQSGYNILQVDFSRAAFMKTFRKYSNYPKYFLPSEFINNGINQLPIFLLGALGSLTSVGYYNMSLRILGLPISFVSGSVAEVFRQRASEDYNERGTCRPIFLKTLAVLAALAVVPFVVIIFWGSEIFAWALGEKWRNAGVYTEALGLMYFFRFIVGPLSYIYVVANNLKGDLINHIYFFISSLAILYFLIPVNILTAFLVYSLNYSMIYLVVLYRSYQLSVNHDLREATV